MMICLGTRITRAVAFCAVLGGAFAQVGCPAGGTIRNAGQIELFMIDEMNGNLHRPHSTRSVRSDLIIDSNERRSIKGDFGERIRWEEDVVTLQIQSLYLNSLPRTFTGSADILVFSEIWENATLSQDADLALNAVVYTAQDQLIPGRVNFQGNLGYGPTLFKAHPLKIKFTVMILQKQKGQAMASAAGVVQTFMNSVAVASPYSTVASQAVAVLRDVLSTQPDVIIFDFEAVLLSDKPSKLLDPALSQARAAADTENAASGFLAAMRGASAPATRSSSASWKRRPNWRYSRPIFANDANDAPQILGIPRHLTTPQWWKRCSRRSSRKVSASSTDIP